MKGQVNTSLLDGIKRIKNNKLLKRDDKQKALVALMQESRKDTRLEHKEFFKKVDSLIKTTHTKVTKLRNFINRLNNNKQVQNDRIEQIIEMNKTEYMKAIGSSTKATSKKIKLYYCNKELKEQLELLKQLNR